MRPQKILFWLLFLFPLVMYTWLLLGPFGGEIEGPRRRSVVFLIIVAFGTWLLIRYQKVDWFRACLITLVGYGALYKTATFIIRCFHIPPFAGMVGSQPLLLCVTLLFGAYLSDQGAAQRLAPQPVSDAGDSFFNPKLTALVSPFLAGSVVGWLDSRHGIYADAQVEERLAPGVFGHTCSCSRDRFIIICW